LAASIGSWEAAGGWTDFTGEVLWLAAGASFSGDYAGSSFWALTSSAAGYGESGFFAGVLAAAFLGAALGAGFFSLSPSLGADLTGLVIFAAVFWTFAGFFSTDLEGFASFLVDLDVLF